MGKKLTTEKKTIKSRFSGIPKSRRKIKAKIEVGKSKKTKPLSMESPEKEKKIKPAKPDKIEGQQRVFIGLGSNVGDREEYIEQAIFLINKLKGIKFIKKSANYENEAEGDTEQPSFINAVIEVRTEISPHKLLEELQNIENALGREREIEWGPRTIDLDILLYGNQILSDDKLQIPHPLLHERTFVLRPLKEISPHLMHPALEKSIEALLEEKMTEEGHTYDDELPGFKKIKGAVYNDYERW